MEQKPFESMTYLEKAIGCTYEQGAMAYALIALAQAAERQTAAMETIAGRMEHLEQWLYNLHESLHDLKVAAEKIAAAQGPEWEIVEDIAVNVGRIAGVLSESLVIRRGVDESIQRVASEVESIAAVMEDVHHKRRVGDQVVGCLLFAEE